MRTQLNFEKKETKELLSKLDLEFFLTQNFNENDYSEKEKDDLYVSYYETLKTLKSKLKKDKKQANYYLEGQVRKMFTGGLLPALFHLDEGKNFRLFDFKEIGKDLAYFKLWQNYYKRKVTSQKIWNIIVKTGSLLAILLTIIKIFEIFNNQ